MIKGEDNNMLERPVVKIAPDTYLVSEYKLVNMFLVVGKHRAALIDTGGGIGPLPEDIERLTGLPLVVIATHGDPDHVGGAGHFPGSLAGGDQNQPSAGIGNTAAVSR